MKVFELSRYEFIWTIELQGQINESLLNGIFNETGPYSLKSNKIVTNFLCQISILEKDNWNEI